MRNFTKREKGAMVYIEKQDVLCLLSAVKLLQEEGFNEAAIEPKRNLCAKLAASLSDSDFESMQTPAWLKAKVSRFKDSLQSRVSTGSPREKSPVTESARKSFPEVDALGKSGNLATPQ